MRWISLGLLICLCLTGADCRQPAPPPVPSPTDDKEDKLPPLVKAINDYRMTQGLKPYTFSPELQKAAQRHAVDMAKHRRLSHTGSDNSSFAERAKQAGFSMTNGGEIIAEASETEAISLWKRSSGHHAQMLGRLTYIGASSVDGYSCAVFGNK